MAKCPKCGANYEGHPTHCPGCGVKFVFKPSQTLYYQTPKSTVKKANQCPKCHALFNDYPSVCPHCHSQLVYVTVALTKNNNSIVPYASSQTITKSNTNIKVPAKVVNTINPNSPAIVKQNNEAVSESQVPTYADLRFSDFPLKTNRGVIKFFFLNLITLSIYSLVYFHKWGRDLNRIRRYYGALPRINYVGAFFLGFVTLGIVPLIFFIRRTKDTYKYARKLDVTCGSSVFWYLSYFLLFWTVVCPIIAAFQIVRTMNRLCRTLNNQADALNRQIKNNE